MTNIEPGVLIGRFVAKSTMIRGYSNTHWELDVAMQRRHVIHFCLSFAAGLNKKLESLRAPRFASEKN